jgi:DNA repair protein RadC
MIMESTNENKQFEVAEIQLSYKSKVKASLRPKISSSKDAEKILRETWDSDKLELVEQFKILLVNRAHKVLGIFEVSQGGIAGTVADPKIIFVSALKAAACGIILAHNHPSGNLNASQADIDLTKKLKEAGRFLEIQILDHIIITSEKYFSFADEGLL